MNEVLLKAEGIYKSFGATKAVVDFHIEVCRGTIHGLIGENGSGKSTLLGAIAGVYGVDKGRITVRSDHCSRRGLCTDFFGRCRKTRRISHCSGNWHDRFNPCFGEYLS